MMILKKTTIYYFSFTTLFLPQTVSAIRGTRKRVRSHHNVDRRKLIHAPHLTPGIFGTVLELVKKDKSERMDDALSLLREDIKDKRAKGGPPAEHHHGMNHSWRGCQGLSSEELDEKWIFPGERPPCPHNNLDGSSVSDNYDEVHGEGGDDNHNHEESDDHSNGSDDSKEENNENNNQSGDDDNSNTEKNENNNQVGNDDNYNSGDDKNDNGSSDDDADFENNKNVDNNQYYNSNAPNEDDSIDDNSFKLDKCDTYSSYWEWDLSLTCDSSESSENCECETAKNLMEAGELVCPGSTENAPYCPSNCGVCDTCLTLLGCTVTQQNKPYMLIALIGVGVIIVASAVYSSTRSTENWKEEEGGPFYNLS